MKSKRSKRDRDETRTTRGIQTEEPENVEIPPEVVREEIVKVSVAAAEVVETVVEVLTNRVTPVMADLLPVIPNYQVVPMLSKDFLSFDFRQPKYSEF